MASVRNTVFLNSPHSVPQAGVDDGQDEHADGPNPGSFQDPRAYNMQHRRRGLALIFNHENFTKQKKVLHQRVGTQRDCDGLNEVLQELRFEVKVCQDYTYKKITNELRRVAAMNHSDADCLLVTVLTHGGPNELHAKDKEYNIKEIWEPFLADKCVTLAGKPKIFIFQACRGDVEMDRDVIMRDMEGVQIQYTMPREADMLMAYACIDGLFAYRDPGAGTWFIQSLIAELRENGTKEDVLTMLTYVNCQVAAKTLEHPRLQQMPNFNSTLRKVVKFTVSNHRDAMSTHQEPALAMLVDTTAGTVDAPEVDVRPYTPQTSLYVGNLHASTTLEQMIRYLIKRGVTDITECRQLRSRAYMKAFKVVISLADLEKTRAPGFWTNGIRVRRLNSPQNARE